MLLAYFVYPSGYLAVRSAERLGVPVVCSCRGNDISKDMFIDPVPLATVLQRSTRLIFVCDSLLHMADTLVSCRAKSTVVANAVDSTLFMPRQFAALLRPQPVMLGISGIMRWKKGLDSLLPLIRSLCELHDLRVLIAGYGLDAVIEQQLANFLAQHGLQQRVEVTGALPHVTCPGPYSIWISMSTRPIKKACRTGCQPWRALCLSSPLTRMARQILSSMGDGLCLWYGRSARLCCAAVGD